MVITPGGIRYRDVRSVKTVWSALIRTRNAEAVFEFADRYDDRALRRERKCCRARGTSAQKIARKTNRSTAQVRRIIWMIRNQHAIDGVMQRQIVERVFQQSNAAISGVAGTEGGREWHLTFNREIPLLRVRHFQSRINCRDRVTRRLWSRRENKTVSRIGEIDWIET